MKASVIFTTYNSPEWLKKTIWGFQQQTWKHFEIIIADDGSTNETRDVVDALREETNLDIKHIWQEDNGFQKCRILNKAVLKASNEYLIFTDGDCIPRKDFVETHIKSAKPGYFLTGTYIKLPMQTSKSITKEDIASERCFALDWLRQHGYNNSKNNIKLTASGKWARFLNTFTTTNANFSGANASLWKDDAIKVGGFDERMHYGGEDREFGVRLKNAGTIAERVRFSAICLHLDHSRGYVDPELVKKNKALRKYNEKHKVAKTDYGTETHTQ